MGFSPLLGNDRLKNNLSAALQGGKTAHFYLISGAPGSGRRTLAKLLSAGLQCEGTDKPCLTCSACRKVMADTHPDILTIDDPEKRNVPVDLIRQARADIYIRPNEGKKKIYIFPRAQDMLPPAQNALLKVLEEPPAYGVFLLITDNPEKLLPTIRSRCIQLGLTALPEATLLSALRQRFPDKDAQSLSAAAARSGGFLGQAICMLEEGSDLFEETQKFLEAYSTGNTLGLTQTLVLMEKYKRDRLIPILEQWESLLQQALICRSGGKVLLPQAQSLATARDPKDLLRSIQDLKKAIDYAKGNVSPAAICGWLNWVLR